MRKRGLAENKVISKIAGAFKTAIKKTANAANTVVEKTTHAADKTVNAIKSIPEKVKAAIKSSRVKRFNNMRASLKKKAAKVEKMLDRMNEAKTDEEKAKWVEDRFNLIKIIKDKIKAAKKAKAERKEVARPKPTMIAKKVNKPSKEQEEEEEEELKKLDAKEEEAQEETQEQVKEPEVVSPVVVKEAEAKASRLLYDLDLE